MKRTSCQLPLLLLLILPSFSFAAKLAFEENFDSYSIDKSKWAYSGNPTTRPSNDVMRKGNYSARVSLNRDNDRDPARTELRKRGFFQFGQESWIGISVYVPGDWQNDSANITAMQWHSVPDKNIGERYRNAPIALRIQNDQWKIVLRWDDEKLTTRSTYDGSLTRAIGRIEKGRWTDFVIRLKLSYKSDGVLEIWKNGSKVFSRQGPNTFNDKIAPFFKFGQYIPVWKKNYPWKKASRNSKARQHILYFDELRIARGTDGKEIVSP